MQFRQHTLAELRTRVYRLTRRDQYAAGLVLAAPAPTNSTFGLEEVRRYPDGYFTGKTVYSVAGTGSGQVRFVSDSDSGTGVVTVSPSLTVVFDATTRVEILPDELTPEAVTEALNNALEELQDNLNVEIATASPVIDSTRMIVDIPDEYVKLHSFSYMDAGGLWREFRPRHSSDLPGQEQGMDFYVRNRKIYLSEPVPSDILGNSIFIAGYRLPAALVLDSDLAEAPAPWLVYKAAANLEQALIGNVDVDSEGHGPRSTGWLAQAERVRPDGRYTNFRPNTMILSPAAPVAP